MANKKKYRIFCNTEDRQVSGFSTLDEPPNLCPNNPEHSVNASSKAIEAVQCFDNLSATVDPTVSDDINDGYGVGSRWVNVVTANEWSCAENTAGAAVWIKTRKDVFGTEYNYASLESAVSTTSSSWIEILELFVNVPSGNYLVSYSWCQRGAARNKTISGRVMQDDSIELLEHSDFNSEYSPSSGMAQVTLTEGTHVFCLEHCSPNSATTSYVRRARIAFWRVS